MNDDQLMLNKVHCMDCIAFLKKLPDNSVDSCVTDPPYGLEFMGKEWDKLTPTKGRQDLRPSSKSTKPIKSKFKQGVGTRMGVPQKNPRCRNCGRLKFDHEKNKCKCDEKNWDTRQYEYAQMLQDWHYEWAVEVFRVLKAGAHLLAFSGTRTYHRLACAIEDVGFEIRDQIHWIYGSGFPKGMNIAKAIDKRLGSDEQIVGKARSGKKRNVYTAGTDDNPDWFGGEYEITAPTSDLAKQWEGWNTQLKPAHEPIVLARKPLSEKSIVDNILIHGTGAINEGACRIAVNPEVDAIGRTTKRDKRQEGAWEKYSGFLNPVNPVAGVLPTGRYPANLILSHHPDCRLIQTGTTKVKDTSTYAQSQKMGKHGIYGDYEVPLNMRHSFDAGEPEVWKCVEGCPVKILNEQSGSCPSGFSPKPSKSIIRGYKWGTLQEYRPAGRGFADSGAAARFFYCAKPSVAERSMGLKGKRNIHITVKPLEVMRWLVRLITPKGGTVLDPFLGSGTTAIAAENEGCDWLACDNNEEYCQIAEARIKALGGTQTRIIDFQDEG